MNAILHNRIFTAPMLWTAGEADAVTRGVSTQQWVASGICVDSASVSPGDLYIHINEDDFESLIEALRRGASCAVVSAVPTQLQRKVPFLIVEDTFRALLDLAAIARLRAENIKTIGILGGVGKSCVRSLLSTALGRQAPTYAKQSDYFSAHINIPLAIANTHPQTKFGIYEMATTRQGEAFAFSKQVQPNIMIVNNITTPNHDHFESFGEIYREYAGAFEAMDCKGVVILNADCPYYPDLMAEARTKGIKKIWGFGGSTHSHARIIDVQSKDGNERVTFEILGERHQCLLPIKGKFMAYNLMAALLGVVASGGNLPFAIKQIEKMHGIAGRGKQHFFNMGNEQNPARIIDQTAHLCPVSIEQAISHLSEENTGKAGRKTLVLGDMPNLGSAEHDIFAEIINDAKEAGIQQIIGCGSFPKGIELDQKFDDVAALAEKIGTIVKDGDTVLLKAGRHTGLRHIITKLQSIHYTNEEKRSSSQMGEGTNDLPVLFWANKAATANDG